MPKEYSQELYEFLAEQYGADIGDEFLSAQLVQVEGKQFLEVERHSLQNGEDVKDLIPLGDGEAESLGLEEEEKAACYRCGEPLVEGDGATVEQDRHVCLACYELYSPCRECLETFLTEGMSSSGLCVVCAEEEEEEEKEE